MNTHCLEKEVEAEAVVMTDTPTDDSWAGELRLRGHCEQGESERNDRGNGTAAAK